MPYSNYSSTSVSQYLLEHDLTLDAFTPIYNVASTNWSKLLLICFCVILFPFMCVINYTRKSYMADHFLYSMEYSSYVVFVPVIILSFTFAAIVWVGEIFSFDWIFIFQDKYTSFILLGLLLYFQIMGTR